MNDILDLDVYQIKVLQNGAKEISDIDKERYDSATSKDNGVTHNVNIQKNTTKKMEVRDNKNVFKNPEEGLNMIFALTSNPGFKMSEKARKKLNALAEKHRSKT